MKDQGLIQSACVIAVHPEGGHFYVLLARRSDKVRMAPGHWVFPGGAVELEDELAVAKAAEQSFNTSAVSDLVYRTAALRELKEEVGKAAFQASALRPVAEWITPTLLPKRYRTRFYLLQTERFEPRCDETEIVDAKWYLPETALEEHASGELDMMFPTVALLDWMSSFASLADMLARLEAGPLPAVLPELRQEGERRFLAISPAAGYRLQRWYLDR